MKITIKVAAEGDRTEGCEHSTTVLNVTSEHLDKMLDNVINYLLTETINWLTDETKATLDAGVGGIGIVSAPFRVEKISHPLRTWTEADKRFLKDVGIGGLE